MSGYAVNPSISMAPASPRRVIVLGNEKGGSGKSTTAMHVTVSLLRKGFPVGVIDLDARQGTLSRYIENRWNFAAERGVSLALPELRKVELSRLPDRNAAAADEAARLEQALHELSGCSFIVIDTPGSDNTLSRLGHALADVLITPMNDSFVDLDLLAHFDSAGERILGPSVYSQMVWEQRQNRAQAGRPPLDWIVMRNRLGHVEARNKQAVARLLDLLARRIGFRLAPGFGERVIFRELFPKGLTLLDLREPGTEVPLQMSHVAAREEVRQLLEVLQLDAAPAAGMAG